MVEVNICDIAGSVSFLPIDACAVCFKFVGFEHLVLRGSHLDCVCMQCRHWDLPWRVWRADNMPCGFEWHRGPLSGCLVWAYGHCLDFGCRSVQRTCEETSGGEKHRND